MRIYEGTLPKPLENKNKSINPRTHSPQDAFHGNLFQKLTFKNQ
jgi:hypothetical protein